ARPQPWPAAPIQVDPAGWPSIVSGPAQPVVAIPAWVPRTRAAPHAISMAADSEITGPSLTPRSSRLTRDMYEMIPPASHSPEPGNDTSASPSAPPVIDSATP